MDSLIGGLPLPHGWCYAAAGDFRRKRTISFNPATAKNELYELWSIPSHEHGVQEIVAPEDIGSSKQYVDSCDVLISKINPRLNRTWVVKDRRCFIQIASTEWIVFSKSKAIDSHYLALLLSDYRIRDYLAANASGVGGSLTRARPALFEEIQIPIPPLNEQHRIVEKIEALFAEIDKGVESLKAAQAALDHYRKSLLKAAFEGRLTADWREKTPDRIKNTDDLIVRIKKQNRKVAREETRNRQKLPPTWCRTTVAEISDPLRYGYTASADPEADGPKLLRITDIQNGHVRWHHVPRCVIPAQKLDQFLLSAGDIVFARTGGTVGKSFLIREVPESSIFASYLIKVRPISGMDPRYLYWFFQSLSYWEQIELAKGGLQGNVNAKMLGSIELPLAPLEEQRQIADEIEASFEKTNQVIERLRAAENVIGNCRQSILKQAFSGKLVPQDPGDEPAVALLDRIKAQRAKKPPKPAPRKRKAAHP